MRKAVILILIVAVLIYLGYMGVSYYLKTNDLEIAAKIYTGSGSTTLKANSENVSSEQREKINYFNSHTISYAKCLAQCSSTVASKECLEPCFSIYPQSFFQDSNSFMRDNPAQAEYLNQFDFNECSILIINYAEDDTIRNCLNNFIGKYT